MKINNLSVQYGDKVVLKDFSLDFPDGKVTCILGPSGCGKTSLLNAIAGVVRYTGEIENRPEKVGFVFQDPTLFDHLTIEKNIDIVLKKEIKDKSLRRARIAEVLDKVELSKEKNAYPTTLSGGMAQRVSLARAFAYESKLLLLDEPFKGLDISLKKKMIGFFSALYESSRPTTIFVTHDVDEAIYLADRVVVLSRIGEIVYETDLTVSTEERDAMNLALVRQSIYDAIE